MTDPSDPDLGSAPTAFASAEVDGLRADPRFSKVRGVVAARAADVWR